MTIKEAIVDIRDNIKPVVGGISLDMAIRSLEAWDKVRKEIASNGQSDINAKYVLNLIDKHLLEVS